MLTEFLFTGEYDSYLRIRISNKFEFKRMMKSQGAADGSGSADNSSADNSSKKTGRLPDEVWASMTQEERQAHMRKLRRRARDSAAKAPRLPDEVWASMTQEERRAQMRKSRGGRKKKNEGHKEKKSEKKAWRFAKGDRVRCNLGGGNWASGAVQAIDQPDEEGGGFLPYVVCLDNERRLISVPTDGNHCVRPDGCFAEGLLGGEPRGEVCEALVRSARATKGGTLRFEAGARVACLTAGPEGTEWPRRWSAGTVVAAWCQLEGEVGGDAFVPYSVVLDMHRGAAGDEANAVNQSANRQLTFVPTDSHLYVRALELQAAEECPQGKPITRFAQRQNKENGWDEVIDQHTKIVRKA